ncbi:hypothetical protein PG984_007563 [Apiospora sp. TS-2023a]
MNRSLVDIWCGTQSTIEVRQKIIQAGHEHLGLLQETLGLIRDVDGFIFTFGFHPRKKSLLESSPSVGGNIMAIPVSEGPRFLILINSTWSSLSDEGRAFAAVVILVMVLRQSS